MLRGRSLAFASAISSILLAAASTPAEDCSGTGFWAAESLEAYDSPRVTVIGDFNGDGRADLAVSIYHGNQVRVFLGQPDGTFTARSYGTAQGVGYQPDRLVAGDIDGDSDPDLVVINSFDRTFTVLKNDGTGLFTVTQTVALGFSFGAIALGDLDGDGDLDLVAAGPASTTKEVQVFSNTGGSFAWSRDYSVAGLPGSLVLGQLDGDGALDVAVASGDDNSVSILWNSGTGVLSAPMRLATLAAPWPLVAGDVDGDGRIDLLTAHGAAGKVGILANQGARGFAPVHTVTTGVRTSTLALGDLDEDGDLDLVVTGDDDSPAVDGASILLNSGTGDFRPSDRFDVGEWPVAIALGDLDGDLDLDVVFTDLGANSIRLFTNRGGRMTVAHRADLGGASGVKGIAHGDLDGDGRPELIVAQQTKVQVLGHVGAGVFAPPIGYPAGASVRGVAAGDVDGDGDIDVVVADDTTDDIAVFRNTGGVLAAPVRFPACNGPWAVALEDMDGDGDRDSVVACLFDNSVKVFRNDGAGAFAPWTGWGWGGAPAGPQALAVGDLDGDGDRDVVVALGNSNAIAVLRNNGGFFPLDWSDTGCAAPESIALGDVNADGRLDIAVSCRLGARVRIYLNAGGGAFTLGETPLVIAPLGVKLADIDGDGDEDLVVVRGNTNSVAVLAGDGTGHFAPARDVAADADPWFMDVVDWDGDGDLDVATGGYTTRASTAVLNTTVGCPASAALSVTGGSVAEGDAGTTSLSFPVTLSTPVSWPVTVDYATADGTATAGSDYEGTSGTLTFAPGETQKTVAVTVFGDTAVEPQETLWLDLSDSVGVPIQTSQAGGTIVDDEEAARLTLDLTSIEGGEGAVTTTPASYVCAVTAGATQHCEYDFAIGAAVTLVPEAAYGSAFLGWTGACTGTGPCVVTMAEALQVGGLFLGPRTLTVQLTSVEGGRGTVWVSPEPLGPPGGLCDNLGGATNQVCTFQYPPDTVVSLAVSAHPDSKFLGWSGACSGTEPCQVPLSGPGPGAFVEASFLGPRTLTVQLTSFEGGRGTVWVSPEPLGPPGAVCHNLGGATNQVCTFQYPPDTLVTLSVSAHPDSMFLGWSGACSGTEPCQVPLSGPGPGPLALATFRGPQELALSIASIRGGRGSLTVEPASASGTASCALPPGAPSAACAFAYAPGTVVTVTALPEPGSVVRALGGCPPAGPCTITMSGSANVSAVFDIANRAPIANPGGPYAGVRGQAILFNGSGSTDPDGDVLAYQWSFSDGAHATGESPSHAFASLGTFVVSLVVSDGQLSSMPATTSVTISNLPPWVALTSPAEGSVHPASAPIPLAADAIDPDGSVVVVEFYAGDVKVGEDFAPPFHASWTGMAPGDYVLTARVTDDSGVTTTSGPRLVHVNPAPTVALTAPASGTTLVAPAALSLAATASDDGAVAAVEFYQGTTLLGVASTPPYTFDWSDVAAGRYVLTARAIDDVGGATVSAPVTVDVVTVVAAAADSYVRDGGSANANFGGSSALQVRVGTSGNTRWTYLRFSLAGLTTIQAAKLRLFGNLSATTTTTVRTQVFSSTNLGWGENSITWNNKPAVAATVLASTTLVNNSTTGRWYEWDLTAFLQGQQASGRTAVTLVLKDDVATPTATFRSRQASSNRPELRITP